MYALGLRRRRGTSGRGGAWGGGHLLPVALAERFARPVCKTLRFVCLRCLKTIKKKKKKLGDKQLAPPCLHAEAVTPER